jgi:hypothetical protein
VGSFRADKEVDGHTLALRNFRVTTRRAGVAFAAARLFDGTVPNDIAPNDDSEHLEVLTAASCIEIVLHAAPALRRQMVRWTRSGRPILSDDGRTLHQPVAQDRPAGTAELKADYRSKRAGPQIEVYFRLAQDPRLGIFRFETRSWSFASDLAYSDVEQTILDRSLAVANNGVAASLALEEVAFIARNGERAGSLVRYVKPVLKVVR